MGYARRGRKINININNRAHTNAVLAAGWDRGKQCEPTIINRILLSLSVHKYMYMRIMYIQVSSVYNIYIYNITYVAGTYNAQLFYCGQLYSVTSIYDQKCLLRNALFLSFFAYCRTEITPTVVVI
jgi:hypothetical protein